MSGGIAGTPGYIAPEVWDDNAATTATDLYALGCIVHEMLTGEELFSGQTPMQAMRAHDRGPLFPEVWPEGTPAGTATVLSTALARDPAARYQSANALWHALNELAKEAQLTVVAENAAAVIAQWRAEAEAAMAAGEWGAAHMALGRWLAIAPGDNDARELRVKLERLSSPPTAPAPLVEPQLAGQLMSSRDVAPRAISPSEVASAPRRRRVPVAWAAAGTLIAVVSVTIAALALSRIRWPVSAMSLFSETATSQIVAAATASTTPTSSATPTITSTPTQTPTVPTATATAEPTPQADALVTKASIDVRAGPGTNYRHLGRYSSGQVLNVLGKDVRAKWLRVQPPNGAVGWVAVVDVDSAHRPEIGASGCDIYPDLQHRQLRPSPHFHSLRRLHRPLCRPQSRQCRQWFQPQPRNHLVTSRIQPIRHYGPPTHRRHTVLPYSFRQS